MNRKSKQPSNIKETPRCQDHFKVSNDLCLLVVLKVLLIGKYTIETLRILLLQLRVDEIMDTDFKSWLRMLLILSRYQQQDDCMMCVCEDGLKILRITQIYV